MELKAQYDLDDLLDLVEQDLEAKGFRLVGGPSPVINQGEGFLITLSIEANKRLADLKPTPAVASEKPEAKPKTKYEMSDKKRQEVLKRAREKYAEKKKAEKLAAKQDTQKEVLPEVVAPATVPFQFQPSHSLNR
jgi:hypothetical protein